MNVSLANYGLFGTEGGLACRCSSHWGTDAEEANHIVHIT